jgi:hypothetical protein
MNESVSARTGKERRIGLRSGMATNDEVIYAERGAEGKSVMPNSPGEEERFLEIWCELMREELKIVRDELVRIHGQGVDDRHLLYAQSCLEECSSVLERISKLVAKKTILVKSTELRNVVSGGE